MPSKSSFSGNDESQKDAEEVHLEETQLRIHCIQSTDAGFTKGYERFPKSYSHDEQTIIIFTACKLNQVVLNMDHEDLEQKVHTEELMDNLISEDDEKYASWMQQSGSGHTWYLPVLNECKELFVTLRLYDVDEST
ncbi:hypothetical protein Tco_0547471 [Tanacetum coccineum]